jgi:hypothetical protein
LRTSGRRIPNSSPAQARHRVGRAQRALQATAEHDEQLVARGVTQRVVDLLEAVEVDNHDGGPPVGAAAGVDDVTDPRVEQGAIGQPRQRVVLGLMLVERRLREQGGLGLLVLGDVLDHGDREAGVS